MQIKQSLLIAILSLCAFTIGNAQVNYQQLFTSQIIYQLKYVPDSNDAKNVKSEYMELLLNDTSSLFRSVNHGIYDSASYVEYLKGNTFGSTIIYTNPTHIFYNIVKTPTQILHSESFPIGGTTVFSYKEPRNLMQWELCPDTLTINGLHCQRAKLTNFGGRNWTAWFSNDIPISDGPYEFCGLPGIIVKISDEKGYWSLTLTGTSNKLTNVFINYNTKFDYKEITKSEYFTKKRYMLENAFNLNEARGAFNTVAPDVKEGVRQNFAKRAKDDNNWIELP